MWFAACDLLMKNIFKKYMQINKRGMGIKAMGNPCTTVRCIQQYSEEILRQKSSYVSVYLKLFSARLFFPKHRAKESKINFANSAKFILNLFIFHQRSVACNSIH